MSPTRGWHTSTYTEANATQVSGRDRWYGYLSVNFWGYGTGMGAGLKTSGPFFSEARCREPDWQQWQRWRLTAKPSIQQPKRYYQRVPNHYQDVSSSKFRNHICQCQPWCVVEPSPAAFQTVAGLFQKGSRESHVDRNNSQEVASLDWGPDGSFDHDTYEELSKAVVRHLFNQTLKHNETDALRRPERPLGNRRFHPREREGKQHFRPSQPKQHDR